MDSAPISVAFLLFIILQFVMACQVLLTVQLYLLPLHPSIISILPVFLCGSG